jgi:hypothetical protein
MVRTALIALLFASPAFAQDSAVNPFAAAGCGVNETHSDVKTDKKQHPTAQPDAGKALVYVIGAAWSDYTAVHFGTPPTRFGIDGTWVGANGYWSYLFSPVEPGDHRLCTDVRSRFERVVRPASRLKPARPTTSGPRRRRDKIRAEGEYSYQSIPLKRSC